MNSTHHSSDRKVRTDTLFLAILLNIIQSIDAWGYKIPGLVIVQLLSTSVSPKVSHWGNIPHGNYIMVRSPGQPSLFHKRTLRWDPCTANQLFCLFSLCWPVKSVSLLLIRQTFNTDFRVKTKIPPTRQSQSSEITIICPHLCAVHHQSLEFR